MLMRALPYKSHDSEQGMRDNLDQLAYPLASYLRDKSISFVGFLYNAYATVKASWAFNAWALAYAPRLHVDGLLAGVIRVEHDPLLSQSGVLCVQLSITPESCCMPSARELELTKLFRLGASTLRRAIAGRVPARRFRSGTYPVGLLAIDPKKSSPMFGASRRAVVAALMTNDAIRSVKHSL